MIRLLRRLQYLLGQRDLEADLREELETHRAMRQAELEARGLSHADASYASRRALGNVTLARENARAAWMAPWLETVWQDLRYGTRTLRRNPGFACVAVVTLGLGIGANTALFSLADTVLWKPLPVANPEQLVFLDRHPGRVFGEYKKFCDISYPLLVALRDRDPLVTGATTFNVRQMMVSIDGEAERVSSLWVSDDFYAVLGVTSSMGRLIQAGDSRGERVAVLSHRYWQRRFGGRPIVGSAITINRIPHTIVGVVPPAFTGVSPGDTFDVSAPLVPAELEEEGMSTADPRAPPLPYAIARLRVGVSASEASASLTSLLQRMMADQQLVTTPADAERHRIEARPAAQGLDGLRRSFSLPLRALLGLVALVLLIGCANTANLLLTRAAARARELATRVSVGASAARLVRQLLTESLLLAGIGGVAGLFLAHWILAVLIRALESGARPIVIDASLDARTLAFTGVVSLGTAVLCGLAPAWHAARLDGIAVASRTRQAMGRTTPLNRLLLVGQVALALVLLVAAGLFVRTLRNLATLDAGFDRRNVLVATLSAAPAGAGGPLEDRFQRLVEGASAIHGVESATLGRIIPLSGSSTLTSIWPASFIPSPGTEPITYMNAVGPRYLETLGIRVVSGRDFTFGDDRYARKVAIVSEAAARLHFPGRNPVGQLIGGGGARDEFEVVGVAADVRDFMLRQPARVMVYLPVLQQGGAYLHDLSLQVRTSADPVAIAADVRRLVRESSPGLSVIGVNTLDDIAERSIVPERLMATLAAAFSGLGLLLAAVGLGGVLAYSVARRTNEIGIRMALGADAAGVVLMVVRELLLLVAVGTVLGLGAGVAGGHAARSLLFGLTPADPVTLLAAVAILSAVALLACWIPARRAARIEPIVALRHE
jgi:predicted permease